MKTNKPTKAVAKSTYSMLVRSQEKKRGYFETIVDALLIVSAVAAILQFAMQPDPLSLAAVPGSMPPA